jgi:hypothetical protein
MAFGEPRPVTIAPVRQERQPDARVRVLPNESMLVQPDFAGNLGDLAQRLLDEGASYAIAVEVDTRERIRPGEARGGASPLSGVELYLVGLATREVGRLADRVFDLAVEWVLRHRRPHTEPIPVTLYGPDDKPIKKVYVDVDGKVRDHPS